MTQSKAKYVSYSTGSGCKVNINESRERVYCGYRMETAVTFPDDYPPVSQAGDVRDG